MVYRLPPRDWLELDTPAPPVPALPESGNQSEDEGN